MQIICLFEPAKGNFPENDFWTPPAPPLLSILYMTIFFYFQQISVHTHVAVLILILKALKTVQNLNKK